MRITPSGIKSIQLEKGFELPNPEDFDDLIAGVDSDIVEEGGASAFIGMIRAERKDWESMEFAVLRPLARHAFNYEDLRFGGMPPKTDLAISKAVLSGMLFEHVVNEGAYPRMNYTKPYNTDTPINTSLTNEFEDFDALWESDQPQAYRLGVQAMATLFIDSLSTTSLETLSRWSEPMVGVDRAQYFNFGFGTSLYLAWDAYSDMMVAQGEAGRVSQYVAANLTRK